jgi:predicted aldo/keto reductase-like oxidoreductase
MYRLLIRGNMKKLGFGTLRLPLTNPDDNSSIDQEFLSRLVDEFMRAGYSYFETGYAYHLMGAEDALRIALTERYPRESFILADKMPTYNLDTVENREKIFTEQVRRLQVTWFDYYLIHNLGESRYPKAEELGVFDFIHRKKEEGFILKIGFSFHGTPDLLEEILTNHPEVDVVQLQINYLDWEHISIQSRRCYEIARIYGKVIIVMEPVKGGGLAVIPKEAEVLMREVRPDDSPASWALRFAAGLDGVIMVLSGMNTIDQMRDNIRTFDNLTPLSEREHAILQEAARIICSTIVAPCTACRYCIDVCKQNISIPVLISIFNDMKRYGDRSFPRVHYQHAVFGHGKASDCVACGECEQICPQHQSIQKILQEFAEKFG